MARKPIHLQAAGPRNDRQAIWEAIRKHGVNGQAFTAADIRSQLPAYPALSKIRDYLIGLTAAEYLDCKKGNKAGMPNSYTLKRDTGIEAPRVRKDGSAVTQGLAREQMWRGMKVLNSFDANDLILAATTEIKLNDAKDYIGHLHKAGYLALTEKSKPSGGLARYCLLPTKYTGPKPPMVQRIKQVFDPNLGKVVWSQGGAS